MQTKSIRKFIHVKLTNMPMVIYKSRFFIALAFAALLLMSGCKKTIQTQQRNVLEQYFEENILNKDFIVHLASENGADITTQFNGFVFKLTKNTLLDGPMSATKGTNTVNGTWTANEDYSKLTITLPITINPSISFLNREWRFTKKAIPIMELAPWGTTEAKVLHMYRQ